jgi:two-component sensor histidine kinase
MMRQGGRVLEKLPLCRDRPLIAYSGTIALCIIAFFARYIVLTALPIGYPYVSFFPAVTLATFLFGWRCGVLASILCWFAAWFFFTPPFDTVKFSSELALPFVFYALVVAIDITLVRWMQVANHRLAEERERSRLLAERSEILFRELQHRISNNLQVVASLLSLQRRNVGDDKARAALDEAARRISLIGRIHRHLHDPSGEQLRLGQFLRQLSADLIDTNGRPGISCSVDGDEAIMLNADEAVPVALVLVEAVSNAIEHGFAHRTWGVIAVHIARNADAITLTVTDNGEGLREGFDLATNQSLGLRLTQMLAKQLGGTFILTGTTGGTMAKLSLPR